MYLVFIIFATIIIDFSESQKNPVVIIPGIAGSRINAIFDETAQVDDKCRTDVENYFAIWLSSTYLLRHSTSCVFDAMKLIYNDETRTTTNVPGVRTFVPGFGGTRPVEIVDSEERIFYQFSYIVERLEREGYEPTVSIRAAPYDWRKGPNEQQTYFDKLKTLVEETYEINEQKQVILLVHSLGALMSRVFLNQQPQEWKDKYIRLEISLAGTWGGTVKAIEAYLMGLVLRLTEFLPSLGNLSDLENPIYKILRGVQRLPLIGNIVLPSITLVPPEVLRTYPAISWLFPSPDVWDSSQVLIQTDDKVYTVNDMEQLFE